MKIVIIQPRVSYYIGGSEKITLKHAEILSSLHNEIVLFTVKPLDGKYSDVYKSFIDSNKNIKIFEIDILKKYSFIYDEEPETNQSRWDRETILFSLLTHDKVKENKPDLVLSYYLVDSVFRNLEIPNVVYLGGHPEKEIEIYNAFLTFCDATISNSKNVKKMWEEKLLKNNVPLNYIVPKGSEKPKILNSVFEKGVNIVFAGRLIPGKGIENLVESFSEVLKKYPEAKLWILGDGPEKENIEKQVLKLKVNQNVNFCGFVDNVQDYFYSSTLCVFPSVFKEGLMTVVAEAMSVGACVVTSSDRGNEELIENGESGVLTPPGDNKILTETILELLDNKDEIVRLGKNAEKFVLENLSWKNVGEKLNNILSDVVSNFDKNL